jgi:hypothetical protein
MDFKEVGQKYGGTSAALRQKQSVFCIKTRTSTYRSLSAVAKALKKPVSFGLEQRITLTKGFHVK